MTCSKCKKEKAALVGDLCLDCYQPEQTIDRLKLPKKENNRRGRAMRQSRKKTSKKRHKPQVKWYLVEHNGLYKRTSITGRRWDSRSVAKRYTLAYAERTVRDLGYGKVVEL